MNTDLIQTKAKTLKTLLEASKKEIEAALPRHLTPDRLMRIALTEARKNPKLLECTQASFLGAIIQTAQLGLEPGSALGQSYLVPFKNKALNALEVQFIVGYRGFISLAYRSPQVSKVIARAVYEGDRFEYFYGTEDKIIHQPDIEANGNKLTHVYAVVTLRTGATIFDVMERKEIDSVRQRSKSPDSGPWDTDFEAMAKKSIIRRLFKFMPVAIELNEAIGMDEAAERGDQRNSSIFETTATKVDSATERTDKFKQHMEADQLADEPNSMEASLFEAPSTPEPGSFQDFHASNIFTSAAPLQTPELTRAEITTMIFTEAEAKNLDITGIGKLCATTFNKSPNELDVEELKRLLKILTNTPAETTKKGSKKK